MNKHLQKIMFYVHGIYVQLKQWFLELSRIKQGGIILGVVVVLFVIVHVLSPSKQITEAVKAPRTVTLAQVADLSRNGTPLSLLGTVTSRSEAVLRAQSSGELSVYKKLGDYVAAGGVIAEFENSGERASVLQAEGAYDAAKAARDIASINSGQTTSSLGDAKVNALNVISNTYVSMDDAVRVKTDAAYSNPRNQDIRFLLSVPDVNLVYTLESKRKALETMLVTQAAHNTTLTKDADLVIELTNLQAEVQQVQSYLNDLASAYVKALPDTTFSQSTISAQQGVIASTRTAMSGTLSSIVSTRTMLTSSLAAEAVAGKTVGGGTTKTATADANVKQALGAYNAALSRLEKSVIRSPISGTINSLPFQTGDFVSPSAQVAVVSNNGALEILAYVTDSEAKEIEVGSKVAVASGANGIVTSIAPALDPVTRKIEVRIGIVGSASSLINGQSVSINIKRTGRALPTATSEKIQIPISAVKITPRGSYVFTVNASSTLVAHDITEGALLGDQIEVLSGITGDMMIVTDARGLKEGITITVSK
jgi:multidrug resistance efflux pump